MQKFSLQVRVASDDAFWGRVELELGVPVPAAIRHFLELEGRGAAFREAATEAERTDIVRGAVQSVRHLWATGVTAAGYGERLVPAAVHDARWALLSKLERAYEAAGEEDMTPGPQWRPLEVTRAGPGREYPFPISQVEVVFDGRLSLQAIVG